MSQITLKQPIKTFRVTTDTDVNELTDFVAEHATVCVSSDGTAIAFGGPYNLDEVIELHEDDILVILAGDIEVFSAEEFDNQFNVAD